MNGFKLGKLLNIYTALGALIVVLGGLGYTVATPWPTRAEFAEEVKERKIIGEIASNANLAYLYRRRGNLLFLMEKYHKQRIRPTQDMKDELRSINDRIRRIEEIRRRNRRR